MTVQEPLGSGIDKAELDDPPPAAHLRQRDVHSPADLRELARLFRDRHGSDPSLEPERSGLDSFDRQEVVYPVLVGDVFGSKRSVRFISSCSSRPSRSALGRSRPASAPRLTASCRC